MLRPWLFCTLTPGNERATALTAEWEGAGGLAEQVNEKQLLLVGGALGHPHPHARWPARTGRGPEEALAATGQPRSCWHSRREEGGPAGVLGSTACGGDRWPALTVQATT